MGKDFATILKAVYNFPPQEQAVIKEVVKEWLRTVSLPHIDSSESTRQLLVCLVDEPE